MVVSLRAPHRFIRSHPTIDIVPIVRYSLDLKGLVLGAGSSTLSDVAVYLSSLATTAVPVIA